MTVMASATTTATTSVCVHGLGRLTADAIHTTAITHVLHLAATVHGAALTRGLHWTLHHRTLLRSLSLLLRRLIPGTLLLRSLLRALNLLARYLRRRKTLLIRGIRRTARTIVRAAIFATGSWGWRGGIVLGSGGWKIPSSSEQNKQSDRLHRHRRVSESELKTNMGRP